MKQPPDPNEQAALVTFLRRLAEERGTESVPRSEFMRHSGTCARRIRRLFGTYNRLVETAGLVPRKFCTANTRKHSSAEVLAEIMRVVRLPDARLTSVFFGQHSPISLCWVRPFGGWINALKAAGHQLDPERESDLVSRIRAHTERATMASRAIQPAADGTRPLRPSADGAGLLYGALINFRGLEHAPVNEVGVSLLFGMIYRELGYVVEMVKPGFPDCAAKRQIRPGIWQRVRIEFEFRSRKFWKHGHKAEGCDVIVCWENDWPDCPIEVLELKSASERLALASRDALNTKEGGSGFV
jgi:hypothetical protein